ncbi:hypothetical protein EV359DRAFT_87434 [Lentinula novae-zelandiae]|nr:hypothetical protein EV359DRAFT_87434 [Lentinula novae-zelandiae]
MGTLDKLFPGPALLHHGITTNSSTHSSQSHPFAFISEMSFWIEPLSNTGYGIYSNTIPSSSISTSSQTSSSYLGPYVPQNLLTFYFHTHIHHFPGFVLPGSQHSFLILHHTWDMVSNQPFSFADGPGWIYIFLEGNVTYKVGRTNNVSRRIREWKQSCHASPKTWLAAIWTPYAHQTERLVHLALEAEISTAGKDAIPQ